MRKLGLITLISSFIISANLYCFDLMDDAFDFIEDIGKLVIILLMILLVMYFIKKGLKDVLNDDRTSGRIKKYRDKDYDDYDDRDLRDNRNYRRRDDDYDDYDDRRRDYRDYDDRDYDDRKNNNSRRDKIMDDRQYEYDMRDYERREKRLPNNIKDNNRIDERENDSRYEKVYELKPEYKLKSDNNKRIR